MVSVYDIADDVATLLEPDATKRDDSRVRPVEFVAGKLYVYPIREQFTSVDTGGTDRHDFVLRAARCVAAEQEEASLVMDRTISKAIEDGVGAQAAAVRAARVLPRPDNSWKWLQIDAVDYDALVTTHVRGSYTDLSGWFIESP